MNSLPTCPFPSTGLIVLVTGGRAFSDRAALWRTLDSLHRGPRGPIELLVHGAASGADTLAAEWAALRGVTQHPVPYERKYGRAGGPIRNTAMVRLVLSLGSDRVCVACPGGTGTADCRRKAQRAGIEILEAA